MTWTFSFTSACAEDKRGVKPHLHPDIRAFFCQPYPSAKVAPPCLKRNKPAAKIDVAALVENTRRISVGASCPYGCQYGSCPKHTLAPEDYR